MSFMRLGTRIAVFNAAGDVLLSKRGDFGTWALPGGRVDPGERLDAAAVREVLEETGLEVAITRTVGLYYQQGRSRMNILYAAQPVAGQLLQSTQETLENRFFPIDQLPENIFGTFYIADAIAGGVHVRTVEASRMELVQLQWKLAVRYVQNLLAGRPEPKFTVFDVGAVGIIFDETYTRVLAYNDQLPIIHSDGTKALDAALHQKLSDCYRWEWVGLAQMPQQDRLRFIFQCQQHATTGTIPLASLPAQQQAYAQQAMQQAPVWLLVEAE